MNNNILTRIELQFWNFVIQTLSQSNFTRAFLKKSYELTHASEVTSLGILVGISGVVGLVSGYLFYFLTAHMR